MEFVLFVLFVGATVVVLVSRGPSPRTPPPPEEAMPPLDLGPLARQRSDTFKPETAVALQKHRILTGAAWVTDGDTITICKTQIRLFGIDAPELHHPYGKKAKWALHALCKGQTIRAEITEIDHYGRTVARCTLPDGRDLSAEMVKQGLAIDWAKFSGGRYRRFETRDARRRLWLADARQKGRMHVWEQFEARKADG